MDHPALQSGAGNQTQEKTSGHKPTRICCSCTETVTLRLLSCSLSCSSLYSNLPCFPHVGGKHGTGSSWTQNWQTGRQGVHRGFSLRSGGGGLMGVICPSYQSRSSWEKANPPPFMMSRLYELCLFSFRPFFSPLLTLMS